MSKDNWKWVDWIKELPSWVKSVIGFITVVIGFVLLWQDNPDIVPPVLLGLFVVGGILGSLYLAFKKTEPLVVGGKGTYQYPYLRGLLNKLGVSTQKLKAKKQDISEENLFDSKKGFNISISCPNLLSKKLESIFLLQLFLAKEYAKVKSNIKMEFQDQEISEHVSKSELSKGDKIRVKFFHPDFLFSDTVTKIINQPLNKIIILGKPKDNCEPGLHKILVSISNAETEQELESFTFTANVVDFVFGNISRPLLSRVSAVVLGIGSFIMFILTLLEQIDKTVGLTSGTAAFVLTLSISASFYNSYQRVRPIAPWL